METELDALRLKINECDRQIMDLLKTRMDVCRQVGEYKKKTHMNAVQQGRYEEVRDRWVNLAEQKGLSPSLARDLFETIHDESVRIQNELL